MSMANTIGETILALKSDKIRDRQEAVQALRSQFSADDARQLGIKTIWSLENALFGIVERERLLLSTSKSKAAATRRLEDAGKALRLVVEKTATYVSRKEIAAALNRLFRLADFQRDLFPLVGLDYLKALKHIASYKPHLDHLDSPDWVKCLELCLNVLLEEPLSAELQDAEEGDRNAMDVDDDDEDEDEDGLPSTQNSRKRATAMKDQGRGAPTKRRRQQISVTSEQVECASLLPIFLQSASSPLANPPSIDNDTDYGYVTPALLDRLYRILAKYPGESSILYDYLEAVSLTLDRVAYNSIKDVRTFAHRTWNNFIQLLDVKDKRIKERLLIVIRHLFPFIPPPTENAVPGSHQSTHTFRCHDALGDLWDKLSKECDNKWGVEALSLDSLRLELADETVSSQTDNPFVASTFQAGWNFDAGQALSWAAIELQADCARQLYNLSESGAARTPGKRSARIQNPVASLLNTIHSQPTTQNRRYHLQVLLFFIDRHWDVLPDDMKHDIATTLLQFVNVDDPDVQPWIFLNLAAVAFAERRTLESNPDLLKPSQQIEVLGPLTWDAVWTHAVRRSNTPGLCRAACHAAHTLLVSLFRFTPPSGHIFLSSQQVIQDIETIGKDLDFQGPSYPYDSVCMFLSRCLRIASQDVRLYKTQLEDKVSKWLSDTWTVIGATKDTAILSTVSDTLVLLGTIAGLSKQTDLHFRFPLPLSPIVGSMRMEKRMKVIRDYLLSASLPPCTQDQQHEPSGAPPASIDRTAVPHSTQLTPTSNDVRLQPRPRERKISAYFARTLDNLLLEWKTRVSSTSHVPVEAARQALDFAITAMAFECALTVNSTLPNSRVLKTAGELLSGIVVYTKGSRWTLPEKISILLGLETIVSASGAAGEGPWEAITPSDYDHDGMARRERVYNSESPLDLIQRRRNTLLRAIWQSNDLQSSLKTLTDTVRSVVDAASGEPVTTSQSFEVDDGFGPIRTSATSAAVADTTQATELLRQLYEVYIPILIRGPLLQSSSGQPTRDRQITERLKEAAQSNPDWFIMVAPLVLREIETGALECNFNQAADLMTGPGSILPLYSYSRDPCVADLTIQLAQATLGLWSTAGSITDAHTTARTKSVVAWFVALCQKGKLPAWESRDRLARFLERYVESDPLQSVWPELKDNKVEILTPMELLASLTTDPDVRVRFRAAVVVPRVLVASQAHSGDLVGVYTTKINNSLPEDSDVYEEMITRLLTVANVMVVSSAVRRGAYWNLLEICHRNAAYATHIQRALEAVVGRLGMPTLVSLFEAYAFQLSISMTRNDIALWEFPPSLLGFKDRSSCIENAFRSYIPAYLLCAQLPTLELHCKHLSKDPRDAQRECFGDAVGFFATAWYDNNRSQEGASMEESLSQILFDTSTLESDMPDNVDSIVAAILRTLGDQDTTAEGPIIHALHRYDPSGESGQVFLFLVRYRKLYSFDTHEPNLPKCTSKSVVQALAWLASKVPETLEKATIYHVFHILFACIEQTPLVNEKYRLINALCLWISMTYKVTTVHPNLLYTIVHGATSLLGQQVLARSAQSMLEWSFRAYRNAKMSDARLSSVLVRVCGIAHDYSKSTHGPLSRLGADLATWIDGQAFALYQVKIIAERVMNALPAWARNPTGPLAELSASVSWSNIDRIFREEHGGPNKFRVVRKLKDYVSNKTPVFRSEVFWRLKESIPNSERLHEEDAVAFTDLLLDNYGHINSLSAEQPDREMQTIRMRHRRQTKGSGSHEAGLIADARDSIIYGLLLLLEDESPTLVQTAYKTLRLILAALPVDPVKSKVWQPVHRDELRLLQSYPPPSRRRPARDLTVLKSAQYVEGSAKFSSWVTHLATLIADILASEEGYDSFGQLYPILSTDVATSEQALPVLVLCLLTHEQQKKPPETQCKEILSEFFTNVLLFPGSCLPVVRCIVETVIHLRYFQMKAGDGAARLTCNQWLDIDFITLAKSAVRCGAYTTAVLFLDLAVDQDDSSPLDSSSTEQIQYEIYAHIDEPDGFYGIKTTNPTHFLVQRLHHENQWDKAFRFHGAMLEAQPTSPTSSDTSGLLESFNAFGFNTLAMQTLRQTDSRSVSSDQTSTSMSYKLGWRSETWDLPDRETYCPGAPLYNALRAMYRERDLKTIDDQLRRSFYREVDQLRRLGIESVAEIKGVLQSLMCLDQILRWRNYSTSGQDVNGIGLPEWPDFEKISPQFDFADLENIMSTRIALVRSVRQKETQRQQIGDIVSPSIEACVKLEQQCLLSLSRAARDTNQTQIALNSIVKAQKLGSSPEVSQEYANVLWSLNEPKLAVDHLADMVDRVAQTDSKLLKPMLLARLGTWMSEACLQKPTEIWNTYFAPARRGLSATEAGDASRVAKVFHQCAAFADRQYNAINKSPDMIRRRVYIQRKKQEIEERSKQLSQLSQGSSHGQNQSYKDAVKAQNLAKKLLDDDTALHKDLRGARDEFLKQALNLYSQCLCISEEFDDEAPIKFSSLWFANFDDDIVKEKVIQQALTRIPSRKFIFLAHQLTARMTKKPPPNQMQNQVYLQRLILRLCQEHPFHSVYQVYCLRADTVPSASSSAQGLSARTDRSDAADTVLASLRDDEKVGSRIRDVERACDAYLQWAKYPASKSAPHNQKIPPEMKIRALKRLKIPVLTAETKVDPTMRYEDCLFIRSYKETYDTAGGLNLPKITVCIDEQNQQHKQLFKGNDDMRQDAVMEQVFDLVNNLLYADRETRRRSLRVRSYKVIPLGTQAGVLEFVPDTIPLRSWLFKAHETYRPMDWTPSRAGKKISSMQAASAEERVKAYKEVRRDIKPVFRHYFTEKHKTPLLWFAMRLRYTRSVATTSIVGYILGLGDRHTSNILLHAEGEVVHIDLGIAFDQGKLLPVPELVPFRLTRDMVDGMGVSGTQGVFQRCSEETLRVLREGSDIIMSVLEVFKHDPLHSWTVSEVKIRRVQQDVAVALPEFAGIGIDMNSGTAEEAADRALSSVERKLDKSLSVETAVNDLISEATDIRNLAVIFSGWTPHL